MALVNPNIAMSYRPTVEYQPRNALAEAAQIQSIMGAQTQQDAARMQLDKLRREEAAIETMMQAITAKDGPSDPWVASDAMIKSKVPHYMDMGFKMQESLRQTDRDRVTMGLPPLYGRPSAASSAAPTSAAGAITGKTPMFPIAGKDVPMGTLGTGTFDSARIGDIGLATPRFPAVTAAEKAELVSQAGPGGLTNAMRQPTEGPYTGLTLEQNRAFFNASPAEQAAMERALPSMKIPGVSAGQVPAYSQLSRDLLSPETRAAADLGYAPATQVNALAPTAPVAQVNQLAATQPAVATPAAKAPVMSPEERRAREMLLSSNAGVREAGKAELAKLTASHVISPGGTLIVGGKPVYTAPPAQNATIVGVVKGTDNPVYFDARTDQQFTIGTDASGKQVRTPYTGAVNRSTSTVTATATSSPAGKSLAAEVGARANTSLVKAEGAVGIMDNANMVREALNTGNVIAGPLAGVRTKFAQVLELAGAGDKEKLINTRSAIQGLASLTLESRAELKGQGQITDTETKLLERARSGSIEDMTIAELQQVVSISQRLANRMWSSHQNLLGTMEGDPAAADTIRYYRPTIPLPQAIGEGKPRAEADKRTQGLDKIFKQPGR